MSKCKLCQAGDPSINVRCWDCRKLFHIHQSQYGWVPEGTVILADCPSCGMVNCWHKLVEGVIMCPAPVLYYGAPIWDLREK